MVSDLLSDNNSTNRRGESDYRSTSLFPYSEIFEKKFPYYLSIGMSEEQYWDKDSTLVKAFREAQELRSERRNEELWLQGMYIYDAIARLSPILRPFAKKGSKPLPYPEEAYPINQRTLKEAEEKKEKIKQQKALRYMEALMVRNNSRFEERK